MVNRKYAQKLIDVAINTLKQNGAIVIQNGDMYGVFADDYQAYVDKKQLLELADSLQGE